MADLRCLPVWNVWVSMLSSIYPVDIVRMHFKSLQDKQIAVHLLPVLASANVLRGSAGLVLPVTESLRHCFSLRFSVSEMIRSGSSVRFLFGVFDCLACLIRNKQLTVILSSSLRQEALSKDLIRDSEMSTSPLYHLSAPENPQATSMRKYVLELESTSIPTLRSAWWPKCPGRLDGSLWFIRHPSLVSLLSGTMAKFAGR